MRTLIVRLISLFCIGAGAITLPLPIPLGIPLLAVGFALLLTTSNRARAWLRHRRRRSDWLDGNLLRVEPRLPRRLRAALSRTAAVRRRLERYNPRPDHF